MGGSILFVCTANICRSPMAAAIFRKKLEEASRSEPELGRGWRVESAGTWARQGYPAALLSQLVLESMGIDLRDHRSRIVSSELLAAFNLILTMERGHKEALAAEFPELASRIFTVSQMVLATYNIRDPIGGALADYEETASELEKIFTQGFDKIVQLAQDG
jgi:protein-tyrosine phosphatase